MLVQRGFLDLLVSHAPLHSVVFQSRIEHKDMQILVSAAVTVVLRRDMSLNRRLWSWFLGPDPSSSEQISDPQPKSPSSDVEEGISVKQANYFQKYGARFLQDSIIASLERRGGSSTEKARPFRICLSLMDRWEVGGSLVPIILLPALQSAFACSRNAAFKQNDEVLRSASLFFDGVESSLIWGKIVEQLDEAFDEVKRDQRAAETKLDLLTFIIQRFNIREEEMLIRHIPNTVLLGLYSLCYSTSDLPVDSEAFLSKAVDLVYALIVMVPSHALRQPSRTTANGNAPADMDRCREVVRAVRRSYHANEERQRIHPEELGHYILASAAKLCTRALESRLLRAKFTTITDALCNIATKCPTSTALQQSELYEKFRAHLSEPIPDNFHNFSTIHALLALVAASNMQAGGAAFIDQAQLLDLQPLMLDNLWLRLSPWEPKYHVEAVRLIWQLESLSRTQQRTGAQLTLFVNSRLEQHSAEQEECARFATLWEHTMQSQQTTRTERPTGPMMRRVSSMANIHDLNGVDPELVLTRPLLALLDSLAEPDSEACMFLLSWLRQLPSLDRVFSILFTQLAGACSGFQELARKHSVPDRNRRGSLQYFRIIEGILRHILSILRSGSSHVWDVLAELRPQNAGQDAMTGVQYITSTCASLVREQATFARDAHTAVLHQALPLLQEMLDSQHASTIRPLQLEDDLISTLISLLQHPSGNASGTLQTIFLRTITKALKLGLTHPSQDTDLHSSSLLSPSPLRPTSVEKARLPSLHVPDTPPPQLLDCIKTGLSSPSSRLFLDHWVQFLSDILPMYFDAIFSAMIPLVECFCEQINLAFKCMQATFDIAPFPHDPIPISTLAALLHGLELILANAHLRLRRQDVVSPIGKPAETGGSFFGSMVTGAFSGAGNKSSKANSRLTVILCIQDALQTCFAIWRWATHSAEGANVDPTSAATLSFNSLKLRHRTKRILEHLFAAESLECLEVLTVQWLASNQETVEGYDSSDVFSLLHVLSASRPRITLPSILNALYSRTDIEALDASKRSSLTSDLTSLDVAAFLLKYISTIEDDAMDEIWADCTNFLKDVLSNPLPHRQMLPALLELVSLLAEKIDNTNIGELQRMHREIGDIFLRLLTATFTTRPSGNVIDGTTNRRAGHKGDLVTSLSFVVPRLQSVLGSNDRVTTAVNSISSSVIGPTFHAKSFPETLSLDTLQLLLALTVQSPAAKTWKKDIADAFNDARFFQNSTTIVHDGWFPVLRKWSMGDKDRLPDLLGSITAPTTAGLMFGVGANAARLDADRKTQTLLRRISLLMLACDVDTYMNVIPLFAEKLGELSTATVSSSPSSTTRAEIFMVYRALLLSVSSFHLSGLWPLINDLLQAALTSAIPGNREQETFNNVSLLQASKLLDLLTVLSPEEFQLHEWLYITNTVDAVYRPDDWTPHALVEEVADTLDTESVDENKTLTVPAPASEQASDGLINPFLHSSNLDGADLKAMARDDFIKTTLQPFFAQLSMYAYENTYGLGVANIEACRRDLLEDLLDEGTIV
ncbi:hypothetical protein MBLNU457_3235t1 [Dothideomycetes sp. NU457]